MREKNDRKIRFYVSTKLRHPLELYVNVIDTKTNIESKLEYLGKGIQKYFCDAD